MINPYFPQTIDDQADWYANFAAEFPSRGLRLGFANPEINAIVEDCTVAVESLRDVRALGADFSKTINGWVEAQLFGPDGADQPNAPQMPEWPTVASARQGIDARRQGWVQRLKNNPAYDPLTDGAALRTEPTGDPFNPLTYQAVIRTAACTGPACVRLVLAKANGAIDANKLRMRRKGTTAWTDLGNFTKSEVFDRTAVAVAGQPEEREYQAQAVIADAVVGAPSAIATVLVQG